MEGERSIGRVLLVGGGPGDPDLITLRGAEALRAADVVVYDSLVSPALLDLAPDGAERIDVGKRGHDPPTRGQEDINALLVELARAGKTVVRLKGGDPFVFGRGGEEASACRAAGIPFEIVPGVSSAIAGPGFAGIPVTDRRHAASLTVVTGHRDARRPWTSIAWDRLATASDTLVILMAMRNLGEIVEALVRHGRSPRTPAAVVQNAATPLQQVLEAPLGELPERVREEGLGAPAVVVVGEAVRLRAELGWYTPRPLAGRSVLVTRAADAADELAERLREAGAEPVVVPLIRIEPLEESEALARALAGLDSYDALLFTSARGARILAEHARRSGAEPSAFAGAVFCVGATTARAVREEGFPEAKLPATPAHAEALLDAIVEVFPPAGRRFLFAGAEAARRVLPEGLRAAGATVDEVPVYRTERVPFDAASLRAALLRGDLRALTFASPSAVEAFLASLDAPSLEAARRCVVATIGETTARALERAGFPPPARAARPTSRALVVALAEAVLGIPAGGRP